MPTNYLPTTQRGLYEFGINALAQLDALGPEVVGLSTPQADEWSAAINAYNALYVQCDNPTMRTPSRIESKRLAKREMIRVTRRMVNIIQSFPGTTDTMRRDFDLTIKDVDPTPVPVPSQMPRVTIKSVQGNLITLQLMDQDDEKRRPDGVKQAFLYTFIGEPLPGDLQSWRFEGATNRLDPQIMMPASVAPNTHVWVTAQWVNTKAQPGPACTPIETWTNRAGLQQAA